MARSNTATEQLATPLAPCRDGSDAEKYAAPLCFPPDSTQRVARAFFLRRAPTRASPEPQARTLVGSSSEPAARSSFRATLHQPPWLSPERLSSRWRLNPLFAIAEGCSGLWSNGRSPPHELMQAPLHRSLLLRGTSKGRPPATLADRAFFLLLSRPPGGMRCAAPARAHEKAPVKLCRRPAR
eukprot:357412-Chlamydomonas_euryale.AAC.6